MSDTGGSSGYQKKVTLPFKGLDADTAVQFEVIPEFPDIDIQVPGIEKGIIAPYRHKQAFSFYHPVYRSGHKLEDFPFAMRKCNGPFRGKQFIAPGIVDLSPQLNALVHGA